MYINTEKQKHFKRPYGGITLGVRDDAMATNVSDKNTYDNDIFAWSEQQGKLLRRRTAGELVNEAQFDWENIAEEIESVGREQLHAVESFFVQAFLHDLKAQAWPSSRDAPTWQAEARRFRGDAIRRFSPSMRQKINVEKLYHQALRAMPETIDGVSPLPVSNVCLVSLDELLSE